MLAGVGGDPGGADPSARRQGDPVGGVGQVLGHDHPLDRPARDRVEQRQRHPGRPALHHQALHLADRLHRAERVAVAAVVVPVGHHHRLLEDHVVVPVHVDGGDVRVVVHHEAPAEPARGVAEALGVLGTRPTPAAARPSSPHPPTPRTVARAPSPARPARPRPPPPPAGPSASVTSRSTRTPVANRADPVASAGSTAHTSASDLAPEPAREAVAGRAPHAPPTRPQVDPHRGRGRAHPGRRAAARPAPRRTARAAARRTGTACSATARSGPSRPSRARRTAARPRRRRARGRRTGTATRARPRRGAPPPRSPTPGTAAATHRRPWCCRRPRSARPARTPTPPPSSHSSAGL